MNARYCFGCMEPIRMGQMICPHCGYDNSYRHNDVLYLAEGTILNGKYLIGKVLGKGGFGITYLGLDLTLKVKVAVKEYFPNSISSRTGGSSYVRVSTQQDVIAEFQKGLQAFQTEAQTLAMFSSPYIVHVREFFLANNTAYIVMEYVDGIGLDEEIASGGGRMTWQWVMTLMLPLMPELDKLHQKGLIHRDIKPENIKLVIDKNTGEEHLVLLDFGAARGFATNTITYSQILTPGYAPYEQFLERSHQGPYTDVYALCATMYKAITGVKPPSAIDRMMSHNENLLSFKSFNLDVPKGVEKTIFHGLKKEFNDRPQTMAELHSEFKKELSKISDKDWNTFQTTKPSSKNNLDGSTIDVYDQGQNAQPTGKIKNRWKLLLPGLAAAIICVCLLIPVINKTPEPAITISFTYTPTITPSFTPSITNTPTQIPTLTYTPTIEPSNTPYLSEKDIMILQLSEAHAGDTISFGHFEQDANNANGSEPIDWIVLEKTDNRLYVTSLFGLEWSSNDEKWLNTDFYNSAFNEDEKSLILEVDLPKIWNEDASRKKIHLLYANEVEKYFPQQRQRVLSGTPLTDSTAQGNSNWWWLRSEGKSQGSWGNYVDPGQLWWTCTYVTYNGQIIYLDQYCGSRGLLRPAMSISLK